MGSYRSGGDANIVKADGTLGTAAADAMSKVAKMKQLEKNPEDDAAALKRGCAPIKKVMKRKKKSCWKGYERTPNTKKGAKGSCRKIRGGKK